ncbi:hypothetical protein BDV24DRAFT_170436 [Aspergillus arachidicola]|uniref:DUF7587 domain-containing protein n=1 Tax=Aspergillus arachidicola TaxID=656916 RepID=A0A5N6XRJ1_9EURO|nr:hypothetical protein BDV24DRAFT_170436 [Aspergillus arachidicola]
MASADIDQFIKRFNTLGLQGTNKHYDDPFRHVLYFHTYCRSSAGYDPSSEDIRAGIYNAGGVSKSSLKRWVQLQADKVPILLYYSGQSYEVTYNQDNREPTPFKSVTPDPLRAFNYALCLQHKGEQDIHIAVIDAWDLGPYNIVHCNALREHVGEPENNLFKTERLIWQCIPSGAIIARFNWTTVCSTLGRLLPPLSDLTSISSDHKRPLETLRDLLKKFEPKPDLSGLVRILVEDLGLFQYHMTTKQFALMILGWTKGYSQIDCYPTLHSTLQFSMGEEIDAIDYRLYVKECHDRRRFFDNFMPHGTESLEIMKLGIRRCKRFLLPTFEEWVDERRCLEAGALEEAREIVAKPDDFHTRLAEVGIVVPMITTFRSGRRIRKSSSSLACRL